MREGRLGYNSYNKRYGLLSSDLWIDPGFHCGECLEVLVDDQWVKPQLETAQNRLISPQMKWLFQNCILNSILYIVYLISITLCNPHHFM